MCRDLPLVTPDTFQTLHLQKEKNTHHQKTIVNVGGLKDTRLIKNISHKAQCLRYGGYALTSGVQETQLLCERQDSSSLPELPTGNRTGSFVGLLKS